MPIGIYERVKPHGFQKGHTSSPKVCKDSTKLKISLSKKGKPVSLNHKLKLKEAAHHGSDSHLWRGGITSENRKVRASFEYKEWRRLVFERDNYTCQECNAKNGDGKAIILHADHIKQFAYHPELRLDINNGRTLCIDCHKKTDTYNNKIKITNI